VGSLTGSSLHPHTVTRHDFLRVSVQDEPLALRL